MKGKLHKNLIGQWEIVDENDGRVGRLFCELTSGDQIEIYSFSKARWLKVMIVFDGRQYVAESGDTLFIGQPARTIGRSK